MRERGIREKFGKRKRRNDDNEVKREKGKGRIGSEEGKVNVWEKEE